MFNPLAGSAGSLALVRVAPDLGDYLPDVSAAVPVAIAGIRSWKLSVKLTSGKVINIASEGSAEGVLWEDVIQGGIAAWSVAIEGEFDGDPALATTTPLLLPMGAIVAMDLVYSKVTTLGFHGRRGRVDEFDSSMNIKDTPQMFSAKIEGGGALGVPTLGA